MSVGDPIEVPPIKHFNGGLFDGTPNNLKIGSSIMPFVCEADALDWSQIEPAIFGTLFERIYNPEKRAQQGRHYTSRKDIETLVEPVVMAPLRRDWDNIKSGIRAADADLARVSVQDFVDCLGNVRILDPACGSGNFLYVALNLLHSLEREVITWALDFGIHPPETRVHPRQLLGIEIDEYAHQLASVVVWIGHIQNEARVGNVGNRDPILDPLDNIDCRDAIIDNSTGEPKPAEWPEADFIVGNPPFLGNTNMRPDLTDYYVDQLYEVWGDHVSARADFCAFWFEIARKQISDGKASRAGLLATQGIRGIDSRGAIDKIKESGDVFFAESERDWEKRPGGADVRVAMVGFDDGTEQEKILDGQRVNVIHSDLTSRTADLTKANPLRENLDIAYKGIDRTGPFHITEQVALQMLGSSNPSGTRNADVIKPYLTASDVTKVPSNDWIIDFGVDMMEDEAKLYELPFEHVTNNVKPFRDVRPKVRSAWWLLSSTRRGMRDSIKPLHRYIVTPRHSKYRVFVWVEHPTLPDGSLVVFAREDDFFMGILQSRVHVVWSLAKGSKLESRPRYPHTQCFDTFPFPHPSSEQRKAVAEAAKTLVTHRENSLSGPFALDNNMKKTENTLTNLYNRNPAWLQADHAELDQAVFDAYGWTEDPADLDDDTILERLLELNLSREPA